MSVLISAELGQQIINYLITQPYQEVAHLISNLQQVQEIDDEQYALFLEAIASQQEHTPEKVPEVPTPNKEEVGEQGSCDT